MVTCGSEREQRRVAARARRSAAAAQQRVGADGRSHLCHRATVSRIRGGSSPGQRADRRRTSSDGAKAVTADRCGRCAAAALDIAGSARAGRDDELTLLRHVQLLADEMKAHAGWLRRRLVVDLLEQGLTQERVATALGVTRQRVTTLVRQTASGAGGPPATHLPRLARPDEPLPAVSWAEDLLLDAVFDRCTHGLALVDADGRFLRVNPSLARLLQRDVLEMVGDAVRSHETVEGPPTTPAHVAPSGAAIAEGGRRTVWQRKDGSPVALHLVVWPVRPARERRLAGYAVEAWPDDGSGGPEPVEATASTDPTGSRRG
jgi:PAS domain-containing protein